jgi:hypothetical protein
VGSREHQAGAIGRSQTQGQQCKRLDQHNNKLEDIDMHELGVISSKFAPTLHPGRPLDIESELKFCAQAAGTLTRVTGGNKSWIPVN